LLLHWDPTMVLVYLLFELNEVLHVLPFPTTACGHHMPWNEELIPLSNNNLPYNFITLGSEFSDQHWGSSLHKSHLLYLSILLTPMRQSNMKDPRLKIFLI
jgi:hypothetical protein